MQLIKVELYLEVNSWTDGWQQDVISEYGLMGVALALVHIVDTNPLKAS